MSVKSIMGMFSGVFHIPGLDRNLIFVSKMADAGVKTIFKKYK